jgi:hypothetical protein
MWHVISQNLESVIHPVCMSFKIFQKIAEDEAVMEDLAKKYVSIWDEQDLTKDPM